MNIKYDEYLAKGTEKLLEIFSSVDVSEGEREAIVSAFSDELVSNIGDINKLKDYEYLIYGVTLKYIDDLLSQVLSNGQSSYSDYENAIKYCIREKEIIQIYEVKKWKLPELSNTDFNKCLMTLKSRQESTSISSKIAEEDHRIDELLKSAQSDFSISACDSALKLLEELANDLAICKQKRLVVPAVNNMDTKKVSKKLNDIRKIAEQKENLHQGMYDVDLQIHNIISMPKSSPEQWKEIIELCQRQSSLINECNKKKWPLPSLHYININELITKYNYYLHMNDLDNEISADRSLLASGKQYKIFFSNCTQLFNCIETCKNNNWMIPELIITDPRGLSEDVREEKKKKDRAKKKKQTIIFSIAGVLAIIILVFFCVVKYREGKVQIPFDASYVKGESLSMIYDELDEAGFENIQKISDTSGWLDNDEVISVSIDNQDSYSKDSYKKPDVSVAIIYSSPDRIYVTDLLKGWKESKYTDIVEKLKKAGFTNIILNESDTADKELDQLTASIELNELDYTNEHCYLPENAPISISYYTLKIGIGNDSAQFIGQDYESVVASLKESGFTNVQTEAISTGWAMGNSVIGVNVNNTDSYDSSASFASDVRIVVKYSSNDRTDITDIVKNWNTKQYTALQTSLKAKGFTNITFKEKTTDNKSANQLVASISINNQQFNQGDCFVHQSAPIVVEYYVLKITIGQKTSYYTENTADRYSSIVTELKNMGYSNITIYRNNALFNGWITKEGSIESITIGGNDSFEATDSFYYDDPIVIVVNTFNGKGCEDITQIQN